MRLRRKPKVNREIFPFDYIGPDNVWGLRNGTPCRILGKRAGGLQVQCPNGKVWVVGKAHVQRPAVAA